MTEPLPFPDVSLSVAVIVQNGRLLLDWNPNWGCFSLPMSKLRVFPDPQGRADAGSESPLEAAIRAAAESLGRPLSLDEAPGPDPEPLELQPYSYRGCRDGQWKRYDRRVFVFRVEGDPAPGTVGPWCWVPPRDVERLRPLSPTVPQIVNALNGNGMNWG